MLFKETVPEYTLELLEKLADDSYEKGFYLAGGTALALRFGHRISVDLDFFKAGEFEVDEIVQMVDEVANDVKVINQSQHSVAMIADQTKLEFLRYDYELLEPIETIKGYHLASLLDNSLMKLSAVTGRGAKKDFCDLSEILERFSLQELLQSYSQKFPKTDVFTVVKSLVWFEDAEDDLDPVFLKNEDSWDKVKTRILSKVSG